MAQNKMIQFAMNLINRNPKIANNPMAQELIGIIQNGSEQRGEMIAENLCKSYGVTKEEALEDAMKKYTGPDPAILALPKTFKIGAVHLCMKDEGGETL